MTADTSKIVQLPLPASLRLIADATDRDVALTIAHKRRGTRLYIPKKAEGSVLEELVGIDAARQIVNELANVVFDVPMVSNLLAVWLKEQTDMTLPEIANELGTSPRTLKYLFSGTTPKRKDNIQQDLFDDAS